jgi:hypothetical protein
MPFPEFRGQPPKSAIDFFFACHSSESWNPVHLNRGSGDNPLNPRLIFSSSVIPAKAGIQFISIAVLGTTQWS